MYDNVFDFINEKERISKYQFAVHQKTLNTSNNIAFDKITKRRHYSVNHILETCSSYRPYNILFKPLNIIPLNSLY